MPLPRSRTPAESTIPRLLTVSSMLPLLPSQQRLQRNGNFGATARLQHLLPTLQEWCCHHPCKARFRLAGSPLPGGRRTLWITTKGFRSLILLFWIYPGATAMNSRRLIHHLMSCIVGSLSRSRRNVRSRDDGSHDLLRTPAKWLS